MWIRKVKRTFILWQKLSIRSENFRADEDEKKSFHNFLGREDETHLSFFLWKKQTESQFLKTRQESEGEEIVNKRRKGKKKETVGGKSF